jgi:general stress protein 26
MLGHHSISFIEEKVRDLENALFFSMSDSVLKIPASVVKILQTDELGQLWFVIPKPLQFIHTFDHEFPVKLDFFRKGRDYYLKILGKAFLVNDPEEINAADCLNENIKQQARKNNIVLVKVKVSRADYSEKKPEITSAKTLLHQVKNKLYSWFQLSHSSEPAFTVKNPVQSKYPPITSFTN